MTHPANVSFALRRDGNISNTPGTSLYTRTLPKHVQEEGGVLLCMALWWSCRRCKGSRMAMSTAVAAEFLRRIHQPFQC